MSTMTSEQVGTMSDEELAAMLNERWHMIVGLLRKVGGEATFTEREIVELDHDATVEMWVEPDTRIRRLRLRSTVIAE